MTRPSYQPDATDRRIINALQEGFPLSSRPFAEAARRLGLTEGALIARLDRLRKGGAITRFGPFFDAAAMGGAFCLCAMAVPEAVFEATAAKVNARPEVAHNYQRSHKLNMWFVLATETKLEIESSIETIERETGHKVLSLPKLREYFVGLEFQA